MTYYTWLAAERQFLVDQAFATFERKGGVVTPSMRQLYARYVYGELFWVELTTEVEARAERARAQAAWMFKFQ